MIRFPDEVSPLSTKVEALQPIGLRLKIEAWSAAAAATSVMDTT